MRKTDTAYQDVLNKLKERGRLKLKPSTKLDFAETQSAGKFSPNELETSLVMQLIKESCVEPVPLVNKPLLPLRGKISTRGGYALKRSDIPPLLDDFLKANQADTVFIVQGGNRHITRYIQSKGRVARDVKLVCASKASLATILRTILDTQDLVKPLSSDQAGRIQVVLSNLPAAELASLREKSKKLYGKKLTDGTLRDEPLFALIELFCSATIQTPFAYPTDDSKLFEEFNAMHDMLEQDTIVIPYLEIVRILLERTHLRKLLANEERAIFVDDLFYRGRTLFTITCILKAFDINPRNTRLYTLCADRVSHNLRSDYITVLNNDVLYPFENSMRTERGYWQRAHGRFVFIDLETFWQYLALTVDTTTSMEIYEVWQALLEELWIRLPSNKLTKKMTYALLWYLVFHKAYDLPIDLSSLTDQRGEGIGYCVPYARIIDNFISQEEAVDKRSVFKEDVRKTVKDIFTIDEKDNVAFAKLVAYYQSHTNTIDYEGLNFMFDIYDYGI
ncbi:MAG: hypothetical protein ACREGD_00070 [Candidatus Saccharimonadales bacterium]